MPFIQNSGPVTISGDFNIGAVEIQDEDTSLRAHVTQAGLMVDIGDRALIGLSVYATIGAAQTRLDTTPLVSPAGYPMDLELEAQFAPCWIYQGGSTVNVPAGHLKRIRENEWQLVTVSGVDEAYFACLRESTTSTASGLLVATRIDRRL
jgi:hypothetical protein